MPVPLPLIAPHAVAMLGGLLPGDLPRLRQAEQLARSGSVIWPPGLVGSVEALAVADVLANATPRQLDTIGRGAVTANDYQALADRRRRTRPRRAAERAAYMESRRGRSPGMALADAMRLADQARRIGRR